MPLRPYQQGGEDPGQPMSVIQRFYEESDVAMEQMYSAWSDLMEERDSPVPDWESFSRHMANVPGLADMVLRRDPQVLATDPLFLTNDWNERVTEEHALEMDTLDQFLQIEEFVPENMRGDYCRLRDMYHGVQRDLTNTLRELSWLQNLQNESPTRELLSRDSTDGMTPAEARFYNTYRNYRTPGALLSRDMLRGYGIGYRLMSLITATELLRYGLGDEWMLDRNPVVLLNPEHPRSSDILCGFGPTTPLDPVNLPGHMTYLHARRAGIDPDSLLEFAREMRAESLRERQNNPVAPGQDGPAASIAFLASWREGRGYDEAVMHLAAWREEDADEIARFAGSLAEEFGGVELYSDAAGRRLGGMLEGLSANARETLAANFDRTFGRYFTEAQMGDGTAFSRVRAGEASLSDLIRNHGGDPLRADQTPEAVGMAKAELMARVLAGDLVSVERELADGTTKRVPLRVETSQRVLEGAVENAARIRGRRPLINQMSERVFTQTLAERQNRIHQLAEDIYQAGRSESPYLDQSGAEAEIRDRMRRDGWSSLAREGIFETSVASTLGAREVAELNQAARELSVRRTSLPAEQAREYDRYLRVMEQCAESLNQIRSDQEFIRSYPALQAAELQGDTQESRLSGQLLAGGLMEQEARKLYQAGTALSQLLRYGMGEISPADRDRIWNGDGGQALRELLQEEGMDARQLQGMTDRLRQEAPAAGSRFAGAEAIPVELVAAGEDIVGSFRPRRAQGERRPWEEELNPAFLGPEPRRYAAQNFDTVMGPIFGPAEREALAVRGMDIYDRIFVDGRSLSDLYRQTPERRPYERMESDMKCLFMENVLAGKRIDVMVADGAGRPVLRRLQPYDRSGILSASPVLTRDGISIPRTAQVQPAGQDEEDRIRSAVEESRRRLENTLSDPAALQNRKEYIRYGQGNGMPGREGFAEPLRGRWRETVLPAKLPLDEEKEWNAGQREALSALWSMQWHGPGTRANGSLPNRLKVSGDPAAEGNRQIRQALDLTDEMFVNLLRTTGADRVDPRLMDKMGLRAPEQLFYIEGKPAEKYLQEMEEYKDLTPDYRPDSEYMRVLRGEIISATMGNVSPVDLSIPEEDGFGIRPRIRELHVDYGSDLMKWDYTDSNNHEISIDLGERQRRQWEGRPEDKEQLNQEHIYPVSEEERNRRQSRVHRDLRRNHMPRIWLAGSQDGQLEPRQRERILALRRYRPQDRQPMEEQLQDVGNELYGEITRQLGLGEQEKRLLLDTGVITSEAEMFYINGQPALDFVRQNVPALRDLRKDSPDFDRILKAQVAAAAVCGHRMVEVGRVMTDQIGNLRASVADVHVDLEPVRLSSDITIPEPNTFLRDPRWDSAFSERRASIRADMQAKVSRARTIRYANGNNLAYSAAARRFDLNRPDMTEAYTGAAAGTGDMLRQYGGFQVGDTEANRMLSSLAQMYLLAQNPGIHLTDLVEPDRFKKAKQAAGKAVTDALRKGMEGRGWDDYDEIVASVAQMVSPLPAQELTTQLRDVRTLDMRQELAAVMGLDLSRRPPYSQEEFLRQMDSPENSPRVSAMMAFVGQIAGDAKRMSRPRMDLTFGRTGSLTVFGVNQTRAYDQASDALQAAGKAEGDWLDAARNYQRIEGSGNREQVAEAAANRLRLENVRQIFAAGGTLAFHTGAIQGALDTRHTEYYRETFRQMDPSVPWLREMAERPFGDLQVPGLSAVAAAVAPVRFEGIDDVLDTRTLIRWANDGRDLRTLNTERDNRTVDLAARSFDAMFGSLFSEERKNRLRNLGLSMMDRIYIEGESIQDRYGRKYSTEPDRDKAEKLMKAEFMVQMMKGARTDVTVERNGVERVAALAAWSTDPRFRERLWLRLPDNTQNFPQFIDPAVPLEGFRIPPMPPEMTARIYRSQWGATNRATGVTANPAPAAEQPGPAEQQIRARQVQDRETRMRERLEEDRRTGRILDSDIYRTNITDDANEAGGADFRDALFPFYGEGEERLKEIFNAGGDLRGNMMIDTAEGWLNRLIDRVTYAGESANRPATGMTIPTRLQRVMGYGPGNQPDMFFIDGMSVDDYARAHGLDAQLDGPQGELCRKAILTAALLGGEHHVDMVRTGMTPEGNYTTGVTEIQMDLSPFDGMVGFFQTRPSRKANRLYGDKEDRNERHRKIKLAADERLVQSLTRELLDEEVAERRELDEAADQDRVNRWRAAQIQAGAVQPREPQNQPAPEPQPAPQVSPQPGPQPEPAPAPQQEPVQSREPQGQPPVQSREPQPAPQPQPKPAPQQEPRQSRPIIQPEEKIPARKKVGLAGIEGAGSSMSSISDIMRKGQIYIDEQLELGRTMYEQEEKVDLAADDDWVWRNYKATRTFLNQRAFDLSQKKFESELGKEYKALAWEYRRLQEGALARPRITDIESVPDKMPARFYNGFRYFLSNVRDILNEKDPEKQERALQGFQARMDMREDIFRFTIGGINFSNPRQIQAHREAFDNLYHLSGLLIDIDRALNPPEKCNKKLEMLHNVCQAAVKAFDPSLPKDSEEKLQATEILRVVSDVQTKADKNDLDFVTVGDVVDRLADENRWDIAFRLPLPADRNELRRQMEEAPKQRIRINPKDREWFEGEMRKAAAERKRAADSKRAAENKQSADHKQTADNKRPTEDKQNADSKQPAEKKKPVPGGPKK